MGRVNYLLDTHTLLWFLYREDLLPPQVINIIQHESVFVSSVNFWEISIKYQKGILDLLGRTPDDLMTICFNTLHFRPLPLDIDTACSYCKLTADHHRDPFDRMLIWQALTHDMTLVSNDVKIMKYKDVGLKMLW